jgi:hypothetical protein
MPLKNPLAGKASPATNATWPALLIDGGEGNPRDVETAGLEWPVKATVRSVAPATEALRIAKAMGARRRKANLLFMSFPSTVWQATAAIARLLYRIHEAHSHAGSGTLNRA